MGGIRFLEGTYDGTKHGAVMVNGLTDVAFGPLFESYDEAEAFVQWVDGYGVVRAIEEGAQLHLGALVEHPDDARSYIPSDLRRVVAYWHENVNAAAAA